MTCEPKLSQHVQIIVYNNKKIKKHILCVNSNGIIMIETSFLKTLVQNTNYYICLSIYYRLYSTELNKNEKPSL